MATSPKIYYDADASAADDTFIDLLPEEEDEQAAPEEVFSQDEETAPMVRVLASASTFAYDLGNVVQPVLGAPFRQVIWRGQLKERHPATGLVHRVNVYRLNDGFWDCYREDELQVA